MLSAAFRARGFHAMGSVYRVVQVKSGQEMNRFVTLVDACVLWVKYPGERRVEEVATGTNDVIRRVSPKECCSTLRKWLPENKFVSKDERADMTVLIEDACGYSEHC
jgi:hypothetical protein